MRALVSQLRRSVASRTRALLRGALAASALVARQVPVPLTPSAAPTPDLSHVPGVVIDYRPATTELYLGSVSIAILPGGDYVASHDFFGSASTRDQSVVFGSHDRGRSWQQLAEIHGQWWSTLFVHRGALYLMGTSRQFGAVIIRRSTDGGRTWTTPTDRDHGLLLDDASFHTAPTPVVVQHGRVWRAMEDIEGGGGWGPEFRAFMLSAPEGSDLLHAESWLASNRLHSDTHWLEGDFGGWLEGNAVVAPNGNVVDVLRVDNSHVPELAAIVQIHDHGRTATFDPSTGFVQMPGGAKKFTIRFDDRSRLYWTLASIVPDDSHDHDRPANVRNTLALMSSPDLAHWTVRRTVLHHRDHHRYAFQYVDWVFDGDDLAAVSRTAYDDGIGGANSYHNANLVTFHRVERFRDDG